MHYLENITSYQLLMLIAGIAGLLLKKTPKHFVAFVFFCVIVEVVVAKTVSMRGHSNHQIYNFYSVICSAYYFSFFYRDIMQEHARKVLLALFFGFILFSGLNMLLWQGTDNLNNYSYVCGMAVVLVTIAVHLVHVMSQRETPILRQREFWLASGIILFYTSGFPFLFFIQEILTQSPRFYDPLYNLLVLGNHFLALGYLMVVLCPVVFREGKVNFSPQK